VLGKLADQLNKNKVVDKMLKDLGCSRDDLKRFVDRWQQRKDAAQKDDPTGEAAKRDLDDALRSLGLRRDKLQQNAVQKDSMRDLKQGYRGAVPLEYQERLRAYNQGVSRATREGE
jgi:DNA-binding transcriptional MerR regulator